MIGQDGLWNLSFSDLETLWASPFSSGSMDAMPDISDVTGGEVDGGKKRRRGWLFFGGPGRGKDGAGVDRNKRRGRGKEGSQGQCRSQCNVSRSQCRLCRAALQQRMREQRQRRQQEQRLQKLEQQQQRLQQQQQQPSGGGLRWIGRLFQRKRGKNQPEAASLDPKSMIIRELRAQIEQEEDDIGALAAQTGFLLDDATLQRYLEVAYWNLEWKGTPVKDLVVDTVRWRVAQELVTPAPTQLQAEWVEGVCHVCM